MIVCDGDIIRADSTLCGCVVAQATDSSVA
jgi:hypothetical protein